MNLDAYNNINKQAGSSNAASFFQGTDSGRIAGGAKNSDAGAVASTNSMSGKAAGEFAITHSNAAGNAGYSRGSIYDNEQNLPGTGEADEKDAVQEDCDNSNSAADKAKERMTRGDEELLDDMGMSIEKYTAGCLDRVLDSIKQLRQQLELSIESQLESMNQVADQFEQIGSVNEEDVTVLLKSSDIPVTPANITMVKNALEMSSVIPDISDDAKAYMIKTDASLSIEEFYKAKYSAKDASGLTGAPMSDAKISDEQFEQLKDSINKIALAGLSGENATESISKERVEQADEDARWILDRGLAFNTDTFTKLQEINNISSQYSARDMVAHITETMRKGINPVSADITAVRAGMSFATLRMVEQRASVDNDSGFEQVAQGMEEIRMQMIESLYYEEDFKQTGNAEYDAEESLELAKASMKIVWQYSDIRTVSSTDADKILADNYGNRPQLSGFADAISRYEEGSTRVRSDLGDRISKAFAGIESLLQSEGIEATTANVRATRLLGYAKMEVNQSNINSMKEYLTAVEETFESLKPAVVVRMVKEGINPLNMEFDELRKTAGAVAKELGASSEKRYSEYLHNLDKNNELTKEERSAYIGIYRLINAVKNTDNAAIAVTAKAGRELTMSNLLMAVRTLRGGGMDTVIDDEFGGIDRIDNGGPRIDEQIVAAATDTGIRADSSRYIYENMLVEGTLRKLDEGDIAAAGRDNIVRLMDERLEDIVADENAKAKEGMLKDSSYESYGNVTDVAIPKATNEVAGFLGTCDMPMTLGNISMAALFLEGGLGIAAGTRQNKAMGAGGYGDVDGTDMKVSGEDVTFDVGHQILSALGMEDGLNRADTIYRSQLEYLENETSLTIMSTENAIEADRMLERLKGTAFLNKLADNRIYSIPVEDAGGDLMNVNLMFLTASKEMTSGSSQSRVDVSVSTESLGRVKVSVSVFVQEISVTVLSDRAKSVDKLKDSDYELRSALENVIGDLETNSANIKLTINYARMQMNEAFGMTSMASDVRTGAGSEDAFNDAHSDTNRTDTDKLCRMAGTLVDYLRKVCA